MRNGLHFKSQGKEIGTSLLEEDKVDLAGSLLEKQVTNLFTVDTVVASEFDNDLHQKWLKEISAIKWLTLDQNN